METCTKCGQPILHPPETEGGDIMVKVKGVGFRCDVCGCNVFRYLKGNNTKYVCNGCRTVFQGEE